MKFKLTALIPFQAILFVLFLLLTFFFNRFAADDYFFIGELRSSSFKEIYNHLYYEWHGRWTSNFLLVYFLKFNQAPLFLMVYNTISVGLLYVGITRSLYAINLYYQLSIKKKTLLIYSVIAISVLFFCTVSASDTWLWYTSSIVYLWSTTAFFFGLSIFFKTQKNFLDYLIFGLSVIYIGGSNEPLTILIILALLFLILKKKETIVSCLGIFLILGAFLINYLSPGTLHRDEITEPLGNLDLWLYSGYAFVDFLFRNFHTTFLPALFLALPFYLLGKQITPSSNKFYPVKQLLISILLIGCVTFFNQMIVVQALGSLPPHRSSMMSSIFIALVMIRYLFLLGRYHQSKFKFIKYIMVVNILGLITFTGYYSMIHNTYSKAVDNRIEQLILDDNNLHQVVALPNSGYLYSAEITPDTSHYTNQHLKSGLGLTNDVMLSTDQ